MSLPGLNQYWARINVSCSRTTTQWRRWGSNPRSLALYHWATAHPYQKVDMSDRIIATFKCIIYSFFISPTDFDKICSNYKLSLSLLIHYLGSFSLIDFLCLWKTVWTLMLVRTHAVTTAPFCLLWLPTTCLNYCNIWTQATGQKVRKVADTIT